MAQESSQPVSVMTERQQATVDSLENLITIMRAQIDTIVSESADTTTTNAVESTDTDKENRGPSAMFWFGTVVFFILLFIGSDFSRLFKPY
ncbi:hypothetical protein H6771_02825 [Candidatus Peribacteria bacterium]|nr:hypothetical protein [Candidatus Peribacteria bacterium]